ncbi:MAG: ATP-binding protein [Bacteroidota bacterium]
MEAEMIYKIILASFIMPLALATILIWFVYNFQKSKSEYEIDLRERQLKEQKLTIDNQIALQQQRDRIASEMHDDLGSGLTSIRFACQKLSRNSNNAEDKKTYEFISSQTQELVQNMSEILWALNTENDDLESFVGYIRKYALEFLNTNSIENEFNVRGLVKKTSITGEDRRNIMLIVKEALHNIVKHSKASKVSVDVNMNRNENFKIKIKDNGIGINMNLVSLGMGINNMKKRAQSLDAKITFNDNSPNGTYIELGVGLDRLESSIHQDSSLRNKI